MAATPGIVEILTNTLSTDTSTRIAAELKLAEYLPHPEAGVALSQLVLTQNAEMSLRQHSASIILRKYITERWSPYFATFKGPAPPVEVKTQIRQAIFHGLSDPNRKIRTLCAHAMSSIANSDWPDEYPELLSSLIALLSSSSPDSVHGAMQVFTEFIKSDLSEDQILPVMRDLLPVLLSILGANETHTPLTRARTVSVFRQCVTALYMVKDQYPQPVKEASATVLPIWLEAFKVLLAADPHADVSNTNNWDPLVVRIQIFKTLDNIHTSFPRVLAPHLDDLLGYSLLHLRSLYPTFARYYLAATEAAPQSSEDEAIELTHLICPIIDFIGTVARGGKAKQWFHGEKLASLVSTVLQYSQITDEDEENWATDANAFVAQEDDETQAYSVRVAVSDLLVVLVDRDGFTAETVAVLQSAIQAIVQSSAASRTAGSKDWWRPLEAALSAIGSQSEAILDCIEDEEESGRANPIDIQYILGDIIPSVLGLAELPFLQGRGFVFASQYSKLLPTHLAGQYLEAAINVIEASDAGIPVKISAVKAIHNFCQKGDDPSLIPFIPRIAKDLGPFLLQTSEETLSLVLETLSVVVEVNDCNWMTTELASALVNAVLEVWSKNSKDPIFASLLSDILGTLASSSAKGVYETVVKEALPPLCNAIGTTAVSESWVAGTAIDLVGSLITGGPETGLGEGFFALLAPNLFKCLAETEDRDVLQNGVICLTQIVRKDSAQLVSWSNTDGRNGLDNVLALVGKLLTSNHESGGLVVGDLIIHLLRKVGDSILPVLPELLQAMVSRMTTAQTATFIQSLVIPFAFLIHSQRDTVLSLLESTNVQGRSGLDILIQTWCENAETFQGFWPTRISTIGLTQLYAAERPSLQNLMVKGDLIIKPATKNVIMTRSRTKTTPHEFTSIAFPVKALKLLLRELSTAGDASTITAQGATYDVDSDDDDNEWTEEEKLNQGFKEDEFAFLSDMLGPRGVNFDNDELLEGSDDEDLKNDPISQMDMQKHLVSFFKECAARNVSNFSLVVDQLGAEEMLVVRNAINEQ